MFVFDRYALKAERLKAGWSQRQLARLLLCTQPEVARWEGGFRRPSVKRIRLIARLFGLPEHCFMREAGFTPSDDPKPDPERTRAVKGIPWYLHKELEAKR